MMNTQLVLIILAVRNLQRSLSFYSEAFDWPQTVDTHVYVEFELSENQRLGLYQREGFGLNIGKAPIEVREGELTGTEIYFYAEDIHESISRLEKAGAQRLSTLSLRDWGDEAIYFADPDGNIIALARKHI